MGARVVSRRQGEQSFISTLAKPWGEILNFRIFKRSFPEYILSHSTLLMALIKVEGPVEGVEMTTYFQDTTLKE